MGHPAGKGGPLPSSPAAMLPNFKSASATAIFAQNNQLPPPPPPAPPSVVRLQLVYDPPVEGCELTPYVLLSNNGSTGSHASAGGSFQRTSSPLKLYNGSYTDKLKDGEETGVRYRWYRCLHRRMCSYPNCPCSTETDSKSKQAKLQCAVCAKSRPAAQDSFFCSTECFRAAWKKHSVNHAATVGPITASPSKTTAKNVGCLDKSSRPLEEVADEEDAIQRGEKLPGKVMPWHEEIDGSVWLEVGRTKTYVPVKEDIGRIMKFEVAPVNREGQVAGRIEFIETSPVLQGPAPPPDRRMIPLPGVYNKPLIGTTFKLMSYNVLAEIYAGPSVYPYCPAWALAWNYRKKNLLRELTAYRADILCLQEVQGDHFDDFFKPEMSKLGYDGVYKQKTRESMGADGKMDGCAIFFKRDRFALREKHVIEYNEVAMGFSNAVKIPSAALNRLMKDNIALVIVLEVLPDINSKNAQRRGPRDCLCVANTHVFWDPDYPDVKLWQVSIFVQELEKICTRGGTDVNGMFSRLPLIIGGDFNSLPESGVHELLSRGRPTPTHPDFSYDQFGILSLSPLQHSLGLRDSYAEASEELQGMPKYTNYTPNFVGEIDYVMYTPDRIRLRSFLQLVPEDKVAEHTALPSQLWSSDHVALMCEFEYLPPNGKNM